MKDEYEPTNRDKKKDKPLPMEEHGRGLKTVILPLLGEKAKRSLDILVRRR